MNFRLQTLTELTDGKKLHWPVEYAIFDAD